MDDSCKIAWQRADCMTCQEQYGEYMPIRCETEEGRDTWTEDHRAAHRGIDGTDADIRYWQEDATDAIAMFYIARCKTCNVQIAQTSSFDGIVAEQDQHISTVHHTTGANTFITTQLAATM